MANFFSFLFSFTWHLYEFVLNKQMNIAQNWNGWVSTSRAFQSTGVNANVFRSKSQTNRASNSRNNNTSRTKKTSWNENIPSKYADRLYKYTYGWSDSSSHRLSCCRMQHLIEEILLHFLLMRIVRLKRFYSTLRYFCTIRFQCGSFSSKEITNADHCRDTIPVRTGAHLMKYKQKIQKLFPCSV